MRFRNLPQHLPQLYRWRENITAVRIEPRFDLSFLPDYDQDKKPVFKWCSLCSSDAAMIITIVLVEIH